MKILFTRALYCGLVLFVMGSLSFAQSNAGRDQDCKALPRPPVAHTIAAKIRGESLANNRKTLVQDLYLKSDDGTQTRAFLIKPYKPLAPRGGAVLFIHLLGPPPDNDREEFFHDAIELSDANVTSLLVEAPWADPEWFPGRKLDQDLPSVLQYVSLLEGQFRFLLDDAKPDPNKIALVGHDFGAMYGALLLQRQPAVKHSVIMAAVPDFADWFLLGRKLSAGGEQHYRKQVSAISPAHYLRCAGKVDVLFQFAETDRFVSKKQADDFIASAPSEKQVLWYAGGHELQEPSRKDRVAWLNQRVGSPQDNRSLTEE